MSVTYAAGKTLRNVPQTSVNPLVINPAAHNIQRMKKQTLENEQGMTLIEIMMVLGLIALCSLWMIRGWQGYQQALKLEQSVQQLRLYLTGLQAYTNWHNSTAILWVLDGAGGCVGTQTPAISCHNAGKDSFRLPDEKIEVSHYSEKTMGFYGRRNAAQAGHITLKNAAGRIRVVLSARGRIRLCSEDEALLGLPVCR
ncbi:prepilin peptidase-dependent protein [Rouxiella sp. Mn2063]|uniref:prepilin peptidase-dependent protein n=1 Tax=Rouxiella sp. Mn2063 TaxID=3395262 RepID=UPI003BCDA220